MKLEARDADDLAVVSSCLQDGLTRVADMAYQRGRRRFVLMVNRFMWERVHARAGGRMREGGERVRCGVHFDSVLDVRVQNIAQDDRDGLLPLLAVTSAETAAGVDITLTFAGGGAVLLRAEVVDCHLADIGEPWPTPSRPDHPDDAPA